MRSGFGRIIASSGMAASITVAAIIAAPMRAPAQAARNAQGAWGGKTKGVGRYADVNGCAVRQLLSGARQRNVSGQPVEYPAHHLEPPRVTRNAKLLE